MASISLKATFAGPSTILNSFSVKLYLSKKTLDLDRWFCS